MREHFVDFARYNRWANARLYAAAFALGGERRRRDIGLFFGSLHATLNHLLLTDRIWLHRLTGISPEQGPLDRILHEHDCDLVRARMAEDECLVALICNYDSAAFGEKIVYRNMAGEPFEQPLGTILAHLFNHQTHHRGHAHAALSQLGSTAPPSLDLIAFQRGADAPDLVALLAAEGEDSRA